MLPRFLLRKRYTMSDQWVAFDGAMAWIGLSDRGQQQLGKIHYIGLFRTAYDVQPGDRLCELETDAMIEDFKAPIAGRLLEFNPAVLKDPSLINRAPEAEGWLYRLQLSPMHRLMRPAQYRKYCENRLY